MGIFAVWILPAIASAIVASNTGRWVAGWIFAGLLLGPCQAPFSWFILRTTGGFRYA
jgi:hypothetical protein